MAKKGELIAYTKFLKTLSKAVFEELTPTELVERYDEMIGYNTKSKAENVCDSLLRGNFCGSEKCTERECPYVKDGDYKMCESYKPET